MKNDAPVKSPVNPRQAVAAAMLSALFLLTGCGDGSRAADDSSSAGESSVVGDSSVVDDSSSPDDPAPLTGCGGPVDDASSSGSLLQATGMSETMALRSAASGNVSDKVMAGFPNLGFTCYANATLKFLLYAVGSTRLLDHLEEIGGDLSQAEKAQAARDFSVLILNAQADTEDVPAALLTFFRSLQKLEAFREEKAGELLFPIMGRQHDVSEFLAKLSDSFGLSALMGSPVKFAQDFDEDGRYWPNVVFGPDDGTLDQVLARAGGADFVVSDVENLHQLTINMVYSGLGQPQVSRFNFDHHPMLRVWDENSSAMFELELKPMQVIGHRGSRDIGHYFTYTHEDQAKRWLLHNDETVKLGSPNGQKPTLINFAVVDRVQQPD